MRARVILCDKEVERLMRIVAGIVYVAVLLAGCAGVGSESPTATPENTATPAATPTITPTPTPTPCSTADGDLVWDLLDEFSQEWEDELTLADNTPRMQLAGQISELQETRRAVQSQEWPECGETAKDYLVEHMDLAIDGFIAFLGQESDSAVSRLFDQSFEAFAKFIEAMADLQP